MTQRRLRPLPALLSAALTAAIGWALLLGLSVPPPRAADEALALFDVASPVPPPPERAAPPPVPSTRPAGRAAPPDLKARPKEVVAPEPIVVPPVPPVVLAGPVPDRGPAPDAGAAERAGPGTGAGGVGDGRGGGGSGDGDGGGRVARRFRYLGGQVHDEDLPEWMAEAGMRGLVVFRFTVGADGRVTACSVLESSGHPALDRLTCRLFQERLRYRPSLDERGRAVADTGVGEQGWGVE